MAIGQFFSQRFGYAVHALAYVARKPAGELTTLPELANWMRTICQMFQSHIFRMSYSGWHVANYYEATVALQAVTLLVARRLRFRFATWLSCSKESIRIVVAFR